MTISAIRPAFFVPEDESRRTRQATDWWGPLAVTLLVMAGYTVFVAWQWSQFTVKSWDLSIFTQLLQSYAHLQPPIVTVKGAGFNLLGDHFHPLLALLSPIYALFPSAFTLLVIQAACFAAAAGIFARTASRLLGSTSSGVLLGLAFGLSWGLQYAAEAQFHEVAVAVLLLTGSLTALLERRWVAATIWAGLLVFVKEDLGLTVVVIGALIAYRSRRALGLWLAVWGLGWFAMATLVVLPLLNPHGSWAYVGSTDPGGLLGDPAGLFNIGKAHTVFLILLATGGLVLRSPIALVLLPTLAWRFLSTNSGYWGPSWHYSAVLMPIAFAALLEAVQRGPASSWGWLRRYSTHGTAVAVTVAVMMMPQLPLWTSFAPSAWEPPSRAEAAESILRSIPAGASVETDIGLMSYLVDDHEVYWSGNANPVQDCLLIDEVSGGTPHEWGDVLDVAERLHPGTAFAIVAQSDGYQLACRP